MLHDIQINPADGSLWIADSRNNRIRAMADVANAPGAVIPTGGLTPPPRPRYRLHQQLRPGRQVRLLDARRGRQGVRLR